MALPIMTWWGAKLLLKFATIYFAAKGVGYAAARYKK